jgi:hypothetical protein
MWRLGTPPSNTGQVRAHKESEGPIRYGGSWVAAASALPLQVDAIRPGPLARLIAAGLRRPRRLAALIALLVRTPKEYVILSGTSAGQALDEYFSQRSLWVIPRRRFCRGVLLLPSDHGAYLRGCRRQALRTNLRRAAAAGIHCEVVRERRRADDDVSEVLRSQWGWLTEADLQARVDAIRACAARPGATLSVARDQHGQPLAIAITLIDNKVSLIKHAVATSHEARWALHDHVVRILIARRVRYLLVDGGGLFGALGFSANVQHYQHLLGYELRHVIPVCTRRLQRRRRLVASLILVAATLAAVAPRAVADASLTRTAPHHAAPARCVSRASAHP